MLKRRFKSLLHRNIWKLTPLCTIFAPEPNRKIPMECFFRFCYDIGLFQRPDPKAGDYPWLNSYTYCGGDPINNIYPCGEFIDVIWDAANVIYDVGAAVNSHINEKENVKGNRTKPDQLIRNSDGSYTYVETKLTGSTNLTKGQ